MDGDRGDRLNMAIDVKAALSRKIGPLPAWGWGVAIGGGLLVWRMIRGGGSGGTSFATEGTATSDGGGAFGLGPLPDFFSPSPSPAPIGFDPAPGSTPPPTTNDSPSSSVSPPTASPAESTEPIASGGIRPFSLAAPTVNKLTAPLTRPGFIAGPTPIAPTMIGKVPKPAGGFMGAGALPASAAFAAAHPIQPLSAATDAASGAVRSAAMATTRAAAQAQRIASQPKPIKKVPTTRKAPTAVTDTVRELAGPNLRGGTRF